MRCTWCGDDPDYIAYHDSEWGKPLHDDRALFEMLILEGMQAGLSWLTILKKRKAFREAFCGFDPERVAELNESDVERLMQFPGIIHNRRKILCAISNAHAFIAIQRESGSFDRFIWSFVGYKPIVNAHAPGEALASTPLSERISNELKARGFKFVGAVTVYSFLQAVGLVNDHERQCYLCRKDINADI